MSGRALNSNCLAFNTNLRLMKLCLHEQRWRKMTTAQEDEKPSGNEEFTHTGSVGEAPV